MRQVVLWCVGVALLGPVCCGTAPSSPGSGTPPPVPPAHDQSHAQEVAADGAATPSSAVHVEPLHVPPGVLRSMWSTPLLQLSLLDAAPSGFLQDALALALQTFREFQAADAGAGAGAGAGDNTGASAGSVNERFYNWQRAAGGSNRLVEDARVVRVVRAFAAAFLANCGVEPAQAARGSVFVWASVHSHGSAHLPHTHAQSVVSGVMYLQVPPGSGAFMVEDPRGPLPPFSNRYMVQPAAGDVLLFPGWLQHAVAPSGPGTTPDTPRISVSFNVQGPWEALSDLNVAFPSRAFVSPPATEQPQRQPPQRQELRTWQHAKEDQQQQQQQQQAKQPIGK